MTRSTLAFALLFLAAPLGAQEADSVPLYGNLGDYHRTITTSAPLAQQYFDQGARLVYGFGHPEAVRAFRAAIRADSACAMCWWGLSWAYGPYINARMDSTNGVHAFEAIQRAVRLKRNATPVERALIDAMATRYVRTPTRANRAGLDSAYMRAMNDVVTRHPDDIDAATLYGESLMVLRPWDQWTRTGEPKPGTEQVLAALESVLSRDLSHPGACHLYIHAVEASLQPERAEACADLLGARIPGASHVPHMPSHIYMRIGRYGDGVVANRRAWHVDQQAAYGGAPGIYPAHNLHMMMTAAAYDGQSAVAAQAARDLARQFPGHIFYPWLINVRFGRWAEQLDAPAPPADRPFDVALWHFARGMAQLANGRTAAARADRAAVDAIRAELQETQRFRSHKMRDLLGIARATLEGEIAAREQRWQDAIRALQEAVPLEDSLSYDEPEPWTIAVRQILGAVQLESGDAAAAEATFRADLVDHPHNGWALFGLAQALEAQGKNGEAAEVRRRFDEAWQRADVWLQSSRMIPRPPERNIAPAGHH